MMLELLIGPLSICLSKVVGEWVKLSGLDKTATVRKALGFSLRATPINFLVFALRLFGVARLYSALDGRIWVLLVAEELITHSTKVGVRWAMFGQPITAASAIAILLNLIGTIIAGAWG